MDKHVSYTCEIAQVWTLGQVRTPIQCLYFLFRQEDDTSFVP